MTRRSRLAIASLSPFSSGGHDDEITVQLVELAQEPVQPACVGDHRAGGTRTPPVPEFLRQLGFYEDLLRLDKHYSRTWRVVGRMLARPPEQGSSSAPRPRVSLLLMASTA